MVGEAKRNEWCANFTRLRSLAVEHYKSPLEPILVYEKVDAEFKRLANGYKRCKINPTTFKMFKVRIIVLDPVNPSNNVVELSARTGWSIRITENNFDVYKMWTEMRASDKVDLLAKSIRTKPKKVI